MAAYRSLLWTLAALVALVVPLTGAPLAQAEPLPVENSLVQISTRADFQGVVGNGTGIILTPEGVVLTNHHVIQGADAIRALTLSNGQTYDADVLGYDRNNDVAVIQLRGAAGLIPAPIGDSSALRVGEPVTTMGNANGTGNPLTREQGAVTELGATISAEDELTGSSHSLDNLIESSTNLRSGDSGGALINGAGQVVGLNAAATYNFRLNGESTPGGQGFAIPINDAMSIVNQIRSGAASPEVHIGPSAILGVGVNAVDEGDGLPIQSVLRGGPAEVAGVRPGDTLLRIDGVPITSANALTSVLDQRYPGNNIEITWRDRAGAERVAQAVLGSGATS
ncbi:S1C family serine protease [Mycolicibacterium tokaiense]|uniref:Trypsin-like serine protease with C-terminal PDZ domain n=1 Tax=Mycolicibacterium tokaiense TaxID=39695 RepID=A0A378TEV0_9MYCO|nr:trypsin-like peptidase domain-containing protein [Mycolicibacterium tokaiense]BBY86170.1 trypsin [Mycolicibacterium tokaiense]STZ59318.1 trypsin-like serine protease with C-terminal PDZ domain [Mycolicibacterium tokaiense]